MPQEYRNRSYGARGTSSNYGYNQQSSRQSYQTQQRNSGYGRQSYEDDYSSNDYDNGYGNGYEQNQAPQPSRAPRQTYSRSARYENERHNVQYAPQPRYPQQRQYRPSNYEMARSRYGMQPANPQQSMYNQQSRWDSQRSRYGMDYEEEYEGPQTQNQMYMEPEENYQGYQDAEMPMQQNEDMEPQKENKWVSVLIGAFGGAIAVGILFVVLYLHETGVLFG